MNGLYFKNYEKLRKIRLFRNYSHYDFSLGDDLLFNLLKLRKMKHWKTYFIGYLSKTAIHFLDEYFKERNIFSPTIEQFCEITEDELLQSWISIPTMKSILLVQQQLKTA